MLDKTDFSLLANFLKHPIFEDLNSKNPIWQVYHNDKNCKLIYIKTPKKKTIPNLIITRDKLIFLPEELQFTGGSKKFPSYKKVKAYLDSSPYIPIETLEQINTILHNIFAPQWLLSDVSSFNLTFVGCKSSFIEKIKKNQYKLGNNGIFLNPEEYQVNLKGIEGLTYSSSSFNVEFKLYDCYENLKKEIFSWPVVIRPRDKAMDLGRIEVMKGRAQFFAKYTSRSGNILYALDKKSETSNIYSLSLHTAINWNSHLNPFKNLYIKLLSDNTYILGYYRDKTFHELYKGIYDL